jgi:alpha-ribazole phosphatase
MMSVINVYLVRHGKTLGPAALNGHTNVAVELKEQLDIAACINNRFEFKSVFTSPLMRCSELAKHIAHMRGVPVTVDSRLMEMNFGGYDGRPFDDIPQGEWCILDQFWQNPQMYPLPNAETMDAFNQRVTEAWQEMVVRADSDTLIVTHGGVIRVILASLLGIELSNSKLFTVLQIANRSCTHIQVSVGLSPYCCIKSIGITL